MGNATANAEYWSNVTALSNTDSTSQQAHYLNNIQALRAQWLPTLNLQLAQDYIWAINNQKFTNIGPFSKAVAFYGEELNPVELSQITPVAATSSSGGVSTVTQSATVTQSGSVVTSTVSGSMVTQSVTSTVSKSSVAMSWSILAVLLVIVLAAAALIAIRRPPTGRAQK